MMIFNVETHGDIRVCPICRRYIVTIANSPHPVARPRNEIPVEARLRPFGIITCHPERLPVTGVGRPGIVKLWKIRGPLADGRPGYAP